MLGVWVAVTGPELFSASGSFGVGVWCGRGFCGVKACGLVAQECCFDVWGGLEVFGFVFPSRKVTGWWAGNEVGVWIAEIGPTLSLLCWSRDLVKRQISFPLKATVSFTQQFPLSCKGL